MLNLAPIDQREDLATKGYVDDAIGAVKAPYGLIVSGNLSSAGWYRVMTFTNTNAAYQRGATGTEVVFHITRRRISSGEESHEIKMLCTYDDVGFLGELSKTFSGTQKIDKIRYTYDSNGAHVDIHVNDASPAVCVSFEVYCEPDRRSMYTAASLESVADAPSGETVLTTFYFNYNTEGVTDGWHYTLQGKHLRATKTITDTLTNYATINGFFSYYIASITTPFTMASAKYYVGTTWSIGNGFSISAGLLAQRINSFNAYALSTASGSQDVELSIVIEGEIA